MSETNQSAEAARAAHEWLVGPGLYRNVIDSAGQYDSKIGTTDNTSLAAHILNAVTVAVNSFVYEAFSPGDDIADYEEPIRVLAAATALHDTNKYVQEKHGIDTDGNTEAAFAVYFGEHEEVDSEGDDFGIEDDFLGRGYRDDLLYLVQRCEIREDSSESRRTETEFRGLERYCRIGDQVASIAQRDGVREVARKLAEKFSEDEVHLETFSSLEQPVLNDLLIGSVKEVISGEDSGEVSGVVIGSTADTVVYLGDEMDRDELEARVVSIIPKKIRDEFDFSCKVEWNSFRYEILSEIEIPLENKESIIARGFRELFHDGPADVDGFEHIPEAFDQYFPVLAKALYLDSQDEFDNSEVQSEYDRLYDLGNQKVKVRFIAYLIKNYERHEEFLRDLVNEVRPALREALEPESDAISTAVERFFGKAAPRVLGSKEDMCFLCGTKSDKPYEKGHETVYQAQGFSRRLPPYKNKSKGGKSICAVCDLEYSLILDLCHKNGINLNRSRPGSRTLGVSIAYFYFDDFLGDVRLRGNQRMGIELGETMDLTENQVVHNLLQPQYYIQPFSFGDHRNMGDKNHRMVAVRQLMRVAQDSGMKVVLGNPITHFESADSVFVDRGAIRSQELLGLDRVERFGPLPDFVDDVDDRTDSHLRRALALFNVVGKIGDIADITNQYLTLDRDSFHNIAHLSVSKAVGTANKPSRPAYLPDEIYEYVKTYHQHQLMEMNTVAERGIDLFGEQYDSKYKKTKIFREALDAFLSGKNQNMSDGRLIRHVASQVYAAADREDYAGHVETEEAEAFVEALRSYLVENDLYDLKKLSDWEDALVNSYYYAYDQLLYDDQ